MKNSEHRQKRGGEAFAPIRDGDWIHEIIQSTTELLVIKQTLNVREEKVEEIGTYVRKHLEELDHDFYSIDERQSTSGCLPHGSSCYLDEWDIILVRIGPHGIDLSEPLSRHSFTVLSHELGHRIDHLNQDPAQIAHASYGEKEIRAWKMAKERYGGDPKFDHTYADDDVQSYEKN